MMSRKKLSIILALGCVKIVKEKKGENIYLARSHIWAFFTKVGSIEKPSLWDISNDAT
jgi:hypothetical protein